MQIKINSLPVEIADKYAEGHPINAAEAAALNRLRAENIGNNLRSKVKELAREDGTYTDAKAKQAQEIVTAYDAEYEINEASARKPSTDPVEKKAEAVARRLVTDAVKKQGYKSAKDFRENAENGEQRFMEKIAQLAEMDEVVAEAKRELEAESKEKARREKLAESIGT